MVVCKGNDVGHLIACQPSAAAAVRLEALIPPKEDAWSVGDEEGEIDKLDVSSSIFKSICFIS